MDWDKEPPSLDDPAEMDSYWTEPTTITVSRYTKYQLDQNRNNQPWDSYLEELRRAKADPLTLNDVDDITEAIKNDLSMANEPGVEIDTERIINRIDDLENRLPAEVAEELQR